MDDFPPCTAGTATVIDWAIVRPGRRRWWHRLLRREPRGRVVLTSAMVVRTWSQPVMLDGGLRITAPARELADGRRQVLMSGPAAVPTWQEITKGNGWGWVDTYGDGGRRS